MPGREEDKKEAAETAKRRPSGPAPPAGEEWRGRVMDFVQQAPSRDDPMFREMLGGSGLTRNGSIEGFIQQLAVFIVKKLPKAYRAVRKSLMGLYLFLSELKTNNGGLDQRKIDNMVGLGRFVR
jgi:hypothetical protein